MLIHVSAEIFLTLTNSCGSVSFDLCNISNMSRLVLPKTDLNDADPFLELEPIRKTIVKPSGVFDFLGLPRELRDLIYLHLFTNPGHHITISNGDGLPRGDWTRLCDDEPKRTLATEFLRSCHQVYHEASLVFYGMNVFVVQLLLWYWRVPSPHPPRQSTIVYVPFRPMHTNDTLPSRF